MRANNKDMIIARKRIELLQGQEVSLKVNKGRNKIVRYNGMVEDIYEGIFTVRDVENNKIYSYPYSTLITKNVKFLRK